MRVLAVVPIFASCAPQRSLTSGRPVVVVAHIVPLKLRPSALRGRAAARSRSPAATPGSAAASRWLVAVLSAAAVLMLTAHSQLESVPLVHHVGPSVSHVPVGEWCLSRHRPAGRLPQDVVHELGDDPAEQKKLALLPAPFKFMDRTVCLVEKTLFRLLKPPYAKRIG
jgi:hypothetical protein